MSRKLLCCKIIVYVVIVLIAVVSYLLFGFNGLLCNAGGLVIGAGAQEVLAVIKKISNN
ncbi:MAG: hypothetical protein NT098_04190 [Candidatus Parcubacteria bacterium]|nr:hypothetical protein [Candidatus Parcubacteria bacterium]